MDGVWGDLRVAVRALARAPSFTLVAVLTLALGIGANTAIFSVFDGVLLRGLPYPEADRLVAVWLDRSGRDGVARAPLGVADLEALREEPDLFAEVAGWLEWSPTLTGRGPAAVVRVASVSDGMLAGVVGVQPSLGRDFLPDEYRPDGTRTTVLSHRFWQERFAGDPGVLGRAVSLDDVPYTVVGVMPSNFRPPFAPAALLWTPVSVDPDRCPDRCAEVRAIGRLADGVSIPVARDRVAVAARRAVETRPGVLVGVDVSIQPLAEDLLGDVPRALHVLLGAFAFVLLIACSNVASLLVARGAAREGEFAVRRALGAGRWVVVRLLLIESLLLSTLGGGFGLGIAAWGTDALASLAPVNLTSIADVGVNGRVLVFTMALAVITGLAFGLLPALRTAWSGGSQGGMSPSGVRSGSVGDAGRLRNAVVVGQVALTVVLLTGAAMTIDRLGELSRSDLGFDPEGVMTVTLDLPASRFADTEGPIPYYDALIDRFRAIPGVVSVGATSAEPMRTTGQRNEFRVQEEAGDPRPGSNVALTRRVSPAFFYTLGQRLLDGRTFAAGDDRSTVPVTVVNEAFAARFFDYPQRSPLGRRVRVESRATPEWRTIVGVVDDVRDFDAHVDAEPVLYLPFHQAPVPAMTVLVRTESSDADPSDEIRQAIAAVDRSRAATAIAPLSDLVAETLRRDRFAVRLLGTFAALALILSTVGLYGVVAHHVTRRLREVGIRLAVGAGGDDVHRMIVRRGLVLLLPGLAVGAVGAFGSLRLIEDALAPGSGGAEALVPLALTVGVLSATALLATWIPARRAATLDPVTVMREE